MVPTLFAVRFEMKVVLEYPLLAATGVPPAVSPKNLSKMGNGTQPVQPGAKLVPPRAANNVGTMASTLAFNAATLFAVRFEMKVVLEYPLLAATGVPPAVSPKNLSKMGNGTQPVQPGAKLV